MQNQLIPVNNIEAEVKPEKIYATIFLIPYIFIAFIIATLLSFDNAESLLILKGIKVSDLPQSIRIHVQECRQRNKVLTIDN
jgi:hypothetical protein